MHTVSIVGEDASVLLERLVGRLSARGSLATITKRSSVSSQASPDDITRIEDSGDITELPAQPAPGHENAIHYTAAGADVAYGHAAEGWSGYGTTDRSIEELIDDLAGKYDYCLLEGHTGGAVETIAVGEMDTDTPLLEIDDPETCALEPILEQIDDTTPHVTLETLVNDVQTVSAESQAGAIATFTGRVRAKEHPDDTPTEYLSFEMYEKVASDRLDTIREELEAREGVHAVRFHHRTGVIERGEEIVYVVVLAGHRREAFRTVEDGIDRLKAEVPIFKKEVTTDETFWVHDQADQQ
ncbi:molybdopterin synthase [Halocatena halophila]|uniref:molybdopterin synthase n=1 Tax=Halocatena halophila TaxID=2814576 RepID=UPI002ED46532